jgi:hypothetical protein
MKRILSWSAVVFLVFFIAYRPQSAAQVAKSIGSAIMDLANGFGDFVTQLVS